MAMTSQRRGEIALQMVEQMIREKGLPGGDNRERLNGLAEDLGIKVEELIEFLKPLYQEMLEKAFSEPLRQRVKID